MTARLVVAAYNEGANLASLCGRVKTAMTAAAIPYSMFVVDDGSKDSTPEVLRELAGSHPLRHIRHEVNRGIAAVFLTGMRAALEGAAPDDPVVVMEGDGTSDPALLPRLIAALEGPCDVAIASRYAPGGAYRGFPLKRLLLSRAANLLLRLVYRLPGVRDYTIFYRAYRSGPLRRALEAHGEDFTSAGGFACNAQMLLRLRGFSRGMCEVPFVYDYGVKKGKSSMRIMKNLRSYLSLFVGGGRS